MERITTSNSARRNCFAHDREGYDNTNYMISTRGDAIKTLLIATMRLLIHHDVCTVGWSLSLAKFLSWSQKVTLVGFGEMIPPEARKQGFESCLRNTGS